MANPPEIMRRLASQPAVAPSGRAEWCRFLGVSALAITSASVVFSVNPNQAGHYPACPLLTVTGFYCPGCGSLRALYALVHLDPVTAWERNPLAVIGFPLLIFFWVAWLRRLTGRGTFHPVHIPARLLYGGLVLILAYWALRNVPGWTFLSPA